MSISRRTILQGSLLGAAGLLSRSSPALAQQAVAPPTPDELGKMARLAAGFMETYSVPGLSVAIAVKGKLAYAEAFGLAYRETGEALTPQHRFRIASVSKSITSAGIFTLIEAGKLRLDSRVFGENAILGDDYFPTPYPGLFSLGLTDRSDVEQITIEHLLTHTAGGWSNAFRDPMFMNPTMSHRELIAWTLGHMPLPNPPGKAYAYSNFGYCILGRVIEKLTGKTYEQYIRENVLGRCDISNMQIAGNTLRQRMPNEVKYYDQTGQDPYGMNVARMDSHGGWIATASDLAMFFVHINGFHDTNQLLGDDTLRTMTAPSAANPAYAKGFRVNSATVAWRPAAGNTNHRCTDTLRFLLGGLYQHAIGPGGQSCAVARSAGVANGTLCG